MLMCSDDRLVLGIEVGMGRAEKSELQSPGKSDWTFEEMRVLGRTGKRMCERKEPCREEQKQPEASRYMNERAVEQTARAKQTLGHVLIAPGEM
jgi:hypothetical protein